MMIKQAVTVSDGGIGVVPDSDTLFYLSWPELLA
jgi:hypothetical protein